MTAERRTEPPKAKIAGRTLRMLLGIVLAWMTYAVMVVEDGTFNLKVVATFVVMIVFYSAVHLGVTKWAPRANPWLGAILAVTPAALVFVFGGPVGRVASVGYIGVSLLLQTIRSEGGCEVMSIPGLLFRRRTHLACVLFSPVDWLESRIARRRASPGADGTTPRS